MDKEHANFEKVYTDIREHLTPKAVPVEIPIGEGLEFHGVINLISRKALNSSSAGTKTGEYDEIADPAELQAEYERYEQDLIEKVVETDDALMERYLGGEEIPHEQLVTAMRAALKRGELFPVLCGAAELTYGMRTLLSELVELVPPPADGDPAPAEKWGSAEKVELHRADDAPFTALVFKTVSEPHVGDVSIFRIFSGSVKNGAEVYNAARTAPEKLNHLSVSQGKDKLEVDVLHAGDIGVVAKLRDTHTNDTLCDRRRCRWSCRGSRSPTPVIHVAVAPKVRGDEDKLSIGPDAARRRGPDLPLGVQRRRPADVDLRPGRAAPRRDPGPAGAEVRRARRPDEAEDPLPRDDPGEGRGRRGGTRSRPAAAASSATAGSGWRRCRAAAATSSRTRSSAARSPTSSSRRWTAASRRPSARGILAGCPVVDFKVELFDGTYHDVDSNEMSFKLAGILAFRNVAPNCKPVLLEPLVDLEVMTPEEYLGAVMGDLSSRRGQILGSEPDGHLLKLKAVVPEAELYKYATQLHSLTQGRGTYRRKFKQYAEMPPEVAAKIVEEHQKEKKEKEEES